MRLDSWEQARREVPAILEKINADPALALAAAANPLLALEELGYDLAPNVRKEFADRIRFGAKAFEERTVLRDKIFKHAGHPFDLDAPKELHAVLFNELKIERGKKGDAPPLTVEQLAVLCAARGVPVTSETKKQPRPHDLLRQFEGNHPIVAPLIRYREIESSQPPFASAATYDRVRRGTAKMPKLRLVARLQTAPAAGK
jgi:hypothetical protein